MTDPRKWYWDNVGREDSVAHHQCVIVNKAGFIEAETSNDNRHLISAAPAMLDALKAIVARIDGAFDEPNLVELGPLCSDPDEDIRYIANRAISMAEGKGYL